MMLGYSWLARREATVAFGSVTLLLFALPVALAQQALGPSARAGYELAHKFCGGCHVVSADSPASVPVGVATFRGIANQAGQTGQKISDALIAPRHPMPDMHLSIEEIANIIAYFETLRTDPSAPPLVGPKLPASKQGPPSRS